RPTSRFVVAWSGATTPSRWTEGDRHEIALLRSQCHRFRGQAPPMITKDLLFGMNILSLAGFAVMFLALNLSRGPGVAKLWTIALMSAGTALLLVGLYVHTPSS